MPRGARCPSCGELTFHQNGAVNVCSNCEAVGWVGQIGRPGGGRGGTCSVCGKSSQRKVHSIGGVDLYHCYGCEATYLYPTET